MTNTEQNVLLEALRLLKDKTFNSSCVIFWKMYQSSLSALLCRATNFKANLITKNSTAPF